jgi:hypothetical protein
MLLFPLYGIVATGSYCSYVQEPYIIDDNTTTPFDCLTLVCLFLLFVFWADCDDENHEFEQHAGGFFFFFFFRESLLFPVNWHWLYSSGSSSTTAVAAFAV